MTLKPNFAAAHQFLQRQAVIRRIKRMQRSHDKSIKSTCAIIKRMVGESKAGPYLNRVTSRRVNVHQLLEQTYGEGRKLYSLSLPELMSLYELQLGKLLERPSM